MMQSKNSLNCKEPVYLDLYALHALKVGPELIAHELFEVVVLLPWITFRKFGQWKMMLQTLEVVGFREDNQPNLARYSLLVKFILHYGYFENVLVFNMWAAIRKLTYK